MKVFNEDKSKELNYDEIDLKKGYLKNDKVVTHVEGNPGKLEKGHYEVIKEYENGGKDMEWIVDEEGEEPTLAHDIEELVQIYVPYNEEELKQLRVIEIQVEIDNVKKALSNSDYKVMKYIEGLISEEEFEENKEYREELREQIRALEKQISDLFPVTEVEEEE